MPKEGQSPSLFVPEGNPLISRRKVVVSVGATLLLWTGKALFDTPGAPAKPVAAPRLPVATPLPRVEPKKPTPVPTPEPKTKSQDDPDSEVSEVSEKLIQRLLEGSLPLSHNKQLWEEVIRTLVQSCLERDFHPATAVTQAALESERANSKFARDRFNLFGIGAVDSNPNLAFHYGSVDEGINGEKGYFDIMERKFPEVWAVRSNPDEAIKRLTGRWATDRRYEAKLSGLPEWDLLSDYEI